MKLSMIVTEIYNEQLRDLLSDKPKKVDCKLQADGCIIEQMKYRRRVIFGQYCNDVFFYSLNTSQAKF